MAYRSAPALQSDEPRWKRRLAHFLDLLWRFAEGSFYSEVEYGTCERCPNQTMRHSKLCHGCHVDKDAV